MATQTAPEFTSQQAQALDLVGAWLKTASPLFNLQGYAGAGKTTIAKAAAELSGCDVVFLAPTGKAASVMRRKGCDDAMTIHRALYTPKVRSTQRIDELTDQLAHAKTKAERDRFQALLREAVAHQKQPAWELKQGSVVERSPLVVVDEGSMVSRGMLDDLMALVPKVLCLSDPAQLAPVKAESPLLSRTPEVVLTEVHRHALDSDVLRAATLVREGREPAATLGPDFRVLRAGETAWEDYKDADQVLVARNATRALMNGRFRQRLGLEKLGTMAPGDRVVFLRNSYDYGVYNGTTGTLGAVMKVDEDEWVVDCDTDEGARVGLPVSTKATVPRWGDDEQVPIDHAYALTVHKAQGSEWDRVLIWDDYFGRERQRWLYTAITRGAKAVTLVKP